ncbi:MAG TPA: phosphonate metabolism protein/1,5-bisphosphokinase (PRPP-forming) PhnN [Bradyrhizobium sp.]|nr:phosphonate metabolism protein/1,5-bisphosphokinase (PRPP-forming) PhnN [Bradyrhizobium sp.]
MTETLPISARPSHAIGPGRLVLVVGPSGAGKDTLLNLARVACADDADIVFARRVVTREASAFESNEQISVGDFRQARSKGAYAVHWEAHGHCYGLPRAIDDDIRAGRTVIANVSRTVIGTMRESYEQVVVVSITAPPQVLAERLAMRSRSSDGQLEHRLNRQVDDASAAPDFTILNVCSAEYHARQFLRIIRNERWDD